VRTLAERQDSRKSVLYAGMTERVDWDEAAISTMRVKFFAYNNVHLLRKMEDDV
jgi:hypothetical protein